MIVRPSAKHLIYRGGGFFGRQVTVVVQRDQTFEFPDEGAPGRGGPFDRRHRPSFEYGTLASLWMASSPIGPRTPL